MLTNITFSIPGDPQGKGRARATRTGRMYTPQKTVAYESLVAMAAQSAMGPHMPLESALAVEIEAVHTVPASWSQKRRSEALAGRVRPTTKPDADNIAKAVADGGNGIAWKDDRQSVSLLVRKVYGEKAEVRVTVAALGPL